MNDLYIYLSKYIVCIRNELSIYTELLKNQKEKSDDAQFKGVMY